MAYVRASAGFSPVVAVIGIFIFACIILGGWEVWRENKNVSSGKLDGSAQVNKPASPKVDPYKGWQSYSNAQYGISFKYPTDWKVSEVGSLSPDTSATRQEYAVNLKRNEDVKYSETVAFEVHGQSLDTSAKWFDDYFGQSSSTKVTKTTTALKGKASVQYVVKAGENTSTKTYLFSVGTKSYEFSSVNEGDASYWEKFDRVFQSFQIK
jgi:hypothetical protein